MKTITQYIRVLLISAFIIYGISTLSAQELYEVEVTEFTFTPSELTVNVPSRTRRFIDQWIEIVLKNIDDIFVNEEGMENLIYARELEVKGRRSRLRNSDYLAKWSEAAGTRQLDYRWRVVDKIINDIIRGLNK